MFVIGEVYSPGAYPLTKKTLPRGGHGHGRRRQAGSRPRDNDRPAEKEHNRSKSPLLPDQADPSELIKVRLRDVLEGERSQNIEVHNLDTIFIPKIKVFYVTGEVKRPGQYTYMKGMTALQAITTAGGFTEKAARER